MVWLPFASSETLAVDSTSVSSGTGPDRVRPVGRPDRDNQNISYTQYTCNIGLGWVSWDR